MNIDIKTALIGAIGGLVGGALIAVMSHFLGLEASRQELLQEARREAYVSWLKVRTLSRQIDTLVDQGKMAEAANVKDEVKELEQEYERKGRIAMGKIATYSGQKVVESVAKWYRTDENLKPCTSESLNAEQQLIAEIKLHQAMRRELLPEEQPVSAADMSVLLLQCDLPSAKLY